LLTHPPKATLTIPSRVFVASDWSPNYQKDDATQNPLSQLQGIGMKGQVHLTNG
jgi:hypothetical protein